MEKFIFIFRGGDTHVSNANSQAAMDIIQTWNDWMQGLAEKGVLAGGEPLLKIKMNFSILFFLNCFYYFCTANIHCLN